MVVGLLRFTLRIPGNNSLKGKRKIVRRVIDRVRARFNVSIAEVADNDRWQTATIGAAAVGNDPAFVNEVLDKVIHSVEEAGVDAWIVDSEIEVVSVGEGWGLATAWDAEDSHELQEEFEGERIPSQAELEEASTVGASSSGGEEED